LKLGTLDDDNFDEEDEVIELFFKASDSNGIDNDKVVLLLNPFSEKLLLEGLVV
jgi:hypothetical protein